MVTGDSLCLPAAELQMAASVPMQHATLALPASKAWAASVPASILLERQADVVLGDGGQRGARARDVFELGLLYAVFEAAVLGKAVEQRRHVIGIAHHLPDTLQADLRIAVEPLGQPGAKELNQRARQHADIGR